MWVKMQSKFHCVWCDLPGSGMVEIGLSGSKIPFWTSSSLLARTDIFRSKAVKENMERERNIIVCVSAYESET